MIPVEQRKTFRPDDHPEGLQRGDCVTACLASLFELPYEECAAGGMDSHSIDEWTKDRFPGLYANYRMLTDPMLVEFLDAYKTWPTHHFERGLWIATIWSPRIPDVEKRGCGCADRTEGKGDPDCQWCGGDPESRFMGIEWGLHAVVMENAKLRWDPDPGPLPFYFRGVLTFRVSDPARVAAAYARQAEVDEFLSEMGL